MKTTAVNRALTNQHLFDKANEIIGSKNNNKSIPYSKLYKEFKKKRLRET